MRVGELHKEITGLRSELGKASAEWGGLKSRNASLNFRVADLHKDIKSIKKELSATRADQKQTLDTNFNIHKERESLQKELAEARATIREAQVVYKDLVAKGLRQTTWSAVCKPTWPRPAAPGVARKGRAMEALILNQGRLRSSRKTR